jgi:hypothetical protein
MSQDERNSPKAVVIVPTGVPTTVPLGPSTSLDLSWLPEDERKALLTAHVGGILDITRKAHELHVSVAVLKSTLDTLVGTTKEISESGNSATVTHTQETNIGRTEVIMGNTDNARSGKLSRSQTGDRDLRLWYLVGGLIALVVIVALVAHH